jgi:uncharacterized protein YjbI with pentapeptide repeats
MTDDQIAEILRLHDMWVRGEPNGRRADLRGAALWGADLRGANLRGAALLDANLRDADLLDANLRDANLRGANLLDADLRDANLRGAALLDANLLDANLWGVTGNMREIRSMHIDTWPVAWIMSPDGVATVQIGCQRHTLSEWAAFDDGTISRMDPQALKWWRANRDFILSTVERFPAVPYGHAGASQEASE